METTYSFEMFISTHDMTWCHKQEDRTQSEFVKFIWRVVKCNSDKLI
jgi:hypothetical protein